MLNLLGAIILLCFSAAISFWEYNREGVFLTPFAVIAWPYTVIVLMINIAGTHFGFFPVTLKSIFFIISCLMVFVMGSSLVNHIFHPRQKIRPLQKSGVVNVNDPFDFYRPLFVFLAILAISAGFLHLFLSIQEVGGWANIASREFKKTYGSGILSHVMLMGYVAFPFLMADFIIRKKKIIFLLLFLLFCIILLRQTKYQIIVLTLSAIYFCNLYKLIKINVKKIILSVVIIYGLFNVPYLIAFSVFDIEKIVSSDVHSFLFNHFFTYLFGGPIAFGQTLNNPMFPLYSLKEIFSVPANIITFLEGNTTYVNIIIRHWVSISNIKKYVHHTNVFSLFGMLYMYIGTYGTFVYLFILGVFAQGLFLWTTRSQVFIGIQFVFSMIMGFLTLSFFGLYFNMLIIYELIILMVIIPLTYRILKNMILVGIKSQRSDNITYN